MKASTPSLRASGDLYLCKTIKKYHKVLKSIKQPYDTEYLTKNAAMTTWTFSCGAAVVCIGDMAGKSMNEVVSLLAHESVHIFQAHMEGMGEDSPGNEITAYAIQAILEDLLELYFGELEIKVN